MPTLTNEETPRIIVYVVGGTPSSGPFDIPFTFSDEDEVQVYLDGVLTTAFTVTKPNAFDTEGNFVTLNVAVANKKVSIVSNVGSTRSTGDSFVAADLSRELDRIYAKFQELSQRGLYTLPDNGSIDCTGRRLRNVGAPVASTDAITLGDAEDVINAAAAATEAAVADLVVDAQAKVAAAAAEKTLAQTARTGAETARTGSEAARDASIAAKNAAETAEDGAETAKTAAEAARDDILVFSEGAIMAVSGFVYKRTVRFEASGQWSRPTGCRAVVLRVQGGGGAGGSVDGINSGCAIGAGGSAGGYGEHWLESPPATLDIGVGAGGVPAAAGNNMGEHGGASNVTATPSIPLLPVGSGGLGGNGMAGTAGSRVSSANVGGAATGNRVARVGNEGDPGIVVAGERACLGGGGGAFLGAGGKALIATGPGNDAPRGGANYKSYGGGGSGALSTDASNRQGGAGAPGVVFVDEYF